jgi:hypothetical protein
MATHDFDINLHLCFLRLQHSLTNHGAPWAKRQLPSIPAPDLPSNLVDGVASTVSTLPTVLDSSASNIGMRDVADDLVQNDILNAFIKYVVIHTLEIREPQLNLLLEHSHSYR